MIRTIAVLGVAALLQAPVHAQAEGRASAHAVGLKIGALGLGLEYTYQVNDRIALRGAINGSQTSFESEEAGIDYDFDLVWDSLSAGVDFHPGRGAFRLSAGYLRNDNRLEALSQPTTDIMIGDTVYTPAEVGTLVGTAGFDDALSLGLGWDWSRAKKFGMSLDLGVLDQGDPTVVLVGIGPLLGDPSFREDIVAETAQLEEELADFDIVPYLTLGFVFRF